MKKRHYYIVNTVRYGALSLFCMIMPFLFGNIGEIEFQAFIFILGVVFGLIAYLSGRKIKETGIVPNEFAPEATASLSDKIRFYKRMIFVSLLAFPVLTFLVIDDIHGFQYHKADFPDLWWPIAYAYKHYGYWGGVLFSPVLGIVVITIFLIIIRKIKREHNRENTTLIKKY